MLHAFLTSFALCASACGAGCSTPFGYSLHVRGGAERSGAPDHVYLEAQRVEGLAADINALVIPADWRHGSTQPMSPGVRALESPIEFAWIAGASELPGARRIPSSALAIPDGWAGEQELEVFVTAGGGRFAPELEFSQYDRIHAALVAGHDAYALVPRRRALKDGFVVFAAAGPPLVWVRLGEVHVDSGEGPLAWTLARSLGAVAYALDVSVIPLAYATGIATFWVGGLAVFENPPEFPETPW